MAYCREAGFEYRDMEREAGAFLTVTEARCRYQRPARFDDIVDVTCWVTESRSRAVSFAYLMHRGAELLAEGETMHMVTDRHGRVIRLPAPYRVFFPLMR